uniref:Uncharacterized protein n=1 Tax=Chromera velia CCMP2878 TaxID=1169474 RepID=A0A0G4HZU5_9ALVE|eukprot:Cvel_34082.t1-p1 / transcript=Cvel_34082.t1 / gene=Cvel_34082 / organism=Chromera_velia_CCMP2878 / gene_product=hypothetical protein / transcript_product=hypothetical protein / location=Cvel_scaffold5735:3771-4523(-) / protein_length=133 / sequence_SO=supercontig / SO=protein_coding / is_pseudo=false
MQVRKREERVQALLVVASVCQVLILLGFFALVLFVGDGHEAPFFQRRRLNVWHEHSASLFFLFAFEFADTIALGVFTAIVLRLSLRVRLMDPLLNLVPGLFYFPHFSPFRARQRGHELYRSVDGLPTASWVVP